MQHEDLVELGKKYLISAKLCNPVYCERGSSMISEIPDVIGFTARDCFIIECKTSVSDFRKDLKKSHRINGGMGNYRYFLFTSELYKKISSEIPQGWGIILYNQQQDRTEQLRFCGSKVFERNLKAEVNFLRSRIFEIQNIGQ